MIETYVICILFAILIKKCSLKPILKYWGTYLFICVEVFYIYLQSEIFKGDYSLLEYESIIKPIFTLILFIFIFKYKIYIQTIIASAFMGIGHLFNYIVIQANNGNMPVYPSISIYTNYAKSNVFDVVQQYNTHRILGGIDTKFKILADYFDTGFCIMSLGDIFIRIGAGIILYYAIKKSKDTINRINMLKIFYNLLSLDFIRISSYKIARFLFKYLKQYNKYTYAYTCKFLFSTLYDFILIVLCNYIFNLNCIIYIVMFSASILRIFTGGVHMNKLWKCTYIWLAMFITGSFIIKSLANININLNTYSIILSIIMGIFIQCFTLIPIGKQFLNYLSKKLDKIFNKQFFRKYF